ncbi:MAG: hypothetical protein KF753_16075 [Caldilineaceae bacterium]|nr:hypothetical protein [Caldilineaceae bacterium]
MTTRMESRWFPGLTWTGLAVVLLLLGMIAFDALQVNLIFLRLEQVLTQSDVGVEDKGKALQEIRLARSQLSDRMSKRQSIALYAVDRLLAQIELNPSGTSTPASWTLHDWSPWRLPEAVPLSQDVLLLGAIVISDDVDFALTGNVQIALLIKPRHSDLHTNQVEFDSPGWRIIETAEGWVVLGSARNWVHNAGFEWPSPDPRAISGLVSPINWGYGGPDAYQRLQLREVDKQHPGQSVCAVGAVRIMPPFQPLMPGRWALFGAEFRTIQGAGAQPYLMAMSPVDGSVPAVGRLAVINEVDYWQKGYGLLQIQEDWLVSLVTDTPDGLQNENCIDNLFVVLLPEVSP